MDSKEQVIKLTDKNVNEIHELLQQKIQIWSEHVLLSGLWWFGVVLTIVPWIIWFFIREKQSTDRLLYVGFFVMVISLVLDVLGDQLGYWHYRYNVIPVLPTYAPWDITLMPLTIMVLLQIKPKVNPIIKAILFALVASYIAEPIIEWMGIYNPVNWKYSYSVPIHILIYLTAHYFSRRKQFSGLIE
ncbi:MAG: CBO0543 family protein [Bacillota bacterium]